MLELIPSRPVFIEKMQSLINQTPSLTEIPRVQRRTVQVLSEYEQNHPRNDAIALAYLSGQHTMTAIAAHFGVHYTTVSRWVKVYESKKSAEKIEGI